jgi:hypothetical protein
MQDHLPRAASPIDKDLNKHLNKHLIEALADYPCTQWHESRPTSMFGPSMTPLEQTA